MKKSKETRAAERFLVLHSGPTIELHDVELLEAVVADDLWPLPKYSEILFIK